MSDPPPDPYGFRWGGNPVDLSYAPNEFECSAPIAHPQPPHFPVETHDGYYWISSSNYSSLPQHAVRGGTDADGSEIYVGRAMYQGDWLPAKVVPDRHQAYVAYGGEEHCIDSFEVLCEQRFEWVPSSEGNIPYNAVVGGRTSDGEPLYIGRTWHEGSQTVGKVHPSHNCLYIPFGGQELTYHNYEILIRI